MYRSEEMLCLMRLWLVVKTLLIVFALVSVVCRSMVQVARAKKTAEKKLFKQQDEVVAEGGERIFNFGPNDTNNSNTRKRKHDDTTADNNDESSDDEDDDSSVRTFVSI